MTNQLMVTKRQNAATVSAISAMLVAMNAVPVVAEAALPSKPSAPQFEYRFTAPSGSTYVIHSPPQMNPALFKEKLGLAYQALLSAQEYDPELEQLIFSNISSLYEE